MGVTLLAGIALTFAAAPSLAEERIPAAGIEAAQAPADRSPGEQISGEQAASSEGSAAEQTSVETMRIFGSRDGVRRSPGSGQYLGEEELRLQSYADVLRILAQVPGVYVRQEDGNGLFPNISLRGVDSTRSAKVTVMEDGILAAPAPYSAPAAYYSPAAGRMQGIEVLKGSSQVRFGPHNTGGVLNYLSTGVPDDLSIYAKAMYGGFEEARVHGYAGDVVQTEQAGNFGVLAEIYFWRSSGFVRIDERPDFRDGDDTGFTTIEPMVKLMWEPPTDRYQRLDFKLGYTSGDAQETYLGLSEADFDLDPRRRYTTTRFDEIERDHWRFAGSHFVELPALRQQGEAGELSTRGYYSRFDRNWRKLRRIDAIDIDGDGAPDAGQRALLARALALDGARDSSGNLTPGTDGMPLEVLRGERAGLISLRNNDRAYELWGVEQTASLPIETGAVLQTFELGWRFHNDEVRRFQRDEELSFATNGTLAAWDPGIPGSGGNRFQQTHSLALHLEDALEIGAVTLRPGIRYEHLWQRATDYRSDPTDTVVREGTNQLDLVGGGLGGTWEITDPVTLFAGVYSGFSPPNPRGAIFEDVGTERSIASEAGLRFDSPEHRLSAEMTGFFTRFNDLIVIDNVGGAGTGNAENVGKVNSGGLELRAAWDPAGAFGLDLRTPVTLSYTYTHATLVGDASSADPESIFAGGLDGNHVPYIPEHSLAAGVGLEWWRAGLYANVTYRGSMYTTASNTTLQLTPAGVPDSRFGDVPAITILDIVGWLYVDAQQRFKLLFGVHNVTNSQQRDTRHPIGPRVNKPRWIYGGLELDF